MSVTSRLHRWLVAPLSWQTVRDTGVWLYQENTVTGARRVVRAGTGHQPVDTDWIERKFSGPPLPFLAAAPKD